MVERRSPKPNVVGSNPTAPTNLLPWLSGLERHATNVRVASSSLAGSTSFLCDAAVKTSHSTLKASENQLRFIGSRLH